VIEVKNALNEPDYSPDVMAARLLFAALEGLIGPANQTPRDVLISSFDSRVCAAARDAGWPTGLLARPGRTSTGRLPRRPRAATRNCMPM